MKPLTTTKMKMIRYLCFALLLQGCFSEQKALKDLNKANDKQPKVVADFVREHFPCKNIDSTIKIDTAYSYISVPCPGVDPLTIYPSDKIDTIYLNKISYKTNIIKKVIAVPSKTITIVKYVEDSAKIKSLSITISQTQSQLNRYQQGKEKDSLWIKWLIICLCLSVLLNIIQLRK